MTLEMKIRCDNAAFEEDNLAHEIGRILRSVHESIDRDPSYPCYRTVFDANGNDVGRFRLSDRSE